MHTLSNSAITVTIADKGAELQSIYNNQNQLEYLWNGDPAAWAKRSPVLFPIIGELKDKSYFYKGQKFQLDRHGFARDMQFTVTDKDETSITFSITDTEKTLSVYPFKFKFSVKYTLVENTLQVSYIVENTGSDTMYFSVGGHPAFKVPLEDGIAFEDYQLVFNEKEIAGRWPLSAEGLIKREATPFLVNESVLPLKKELFASDAIVLIGLKSTSVTIESLKSQHGLTVSFEGFPYLGIWEAKGGDFLCIEPWCGIADSVNATGNIDEKEGIRVLQPTEAFVASFYITLF